MAHPILPYIVQLLKWQSWHTHHTTMANNHWSCISCQHPSPPLPVLLQAFAAVQASCVHLQGVPYARRFALVPMGPPLLTYSSTCKAILAYNPETRAVELKVDRAYQPGEWQALLSCILMCSWLAAAGRWVGMVKHASVSQCQIIIAGSLTASTLRTRFHVYPFMRRCSSRC